MTIDTGTTPTEHGNNVAFKVERTTGLGWYEVMLSPFKTLSDVAAYMEKYKRYYPVEDRVYRITELNLPLIS